MKKILLITESFPFGDSELGFISTEFDEMIKKFRVTVLAWDSKEMISYPVPKDVLCEKYHYKGKLETLLHILPQLRRGDVRSEIKVACQQGSTVQKGKRLLRVLYYSARAAEIQNQIDKIIVEQRIDLIYTYWCTQATVAALRLKLKFSSLKVITRFHGYDLFQERTATDWQVFRPYIAENCDRLVFASEDGRRYFINHWGNAEKTLVSYLGTCARERILPKSGDVLILVSCSNLIPLKRVNLILEGLQLLPKEQKVEWHHYGSGKLENQLQALAKNFEGNNPNHHYIFHGQIPNGTIEGEYHKIGAQLFITTSVTEGGVPVSMMEAFSMGIPAIGTRVGGIPELIEDGKTGFLLPANPTPQQIADSIVKYIALSYDEKLKMSNAAYMGWKERFDARENAIRFVDALAHL